MYDRKITKAPESLIKKGKFQFGCYKHPITKINFLDAKSPYALPMPRCLKNVQLREWQAFQLGNDDYFMMVAIYNAKKISLVQFIFYDKKKNKKLKYEKKVPSWKVKIPNGLYQTQGGYNSNNFKIEVFHDVNSNELKLDVQILNFKDLPDVKTTFKGVHDVTKYSPIVVCLPFSPKRAMYSHKCLMPMCGNLKIGDQSVNFNLNNSFLILDDHKGFYPFQTHYDWVTAAGVVNGALFGFNLTDNQVLNKEKFNENGFWLDGEFNVLPPIKISHFRELGYWEIKDQYNMVDLIFKPIINTKVNLNLGIFKSTYNGPYGFFDGFLKNNRNEKIEVQKMFGMGEDFYLRV